MYVSPLLEKSCAATAMDGTGSSTQPDFMDRSVAMRSLAAREFGRARARDAGVRLLRRDTRAQMNVLVDDLLQHRQPCRSLLITQNEC
jgi:hypothetical protein